MTRVSVVVPTYGRPESLRRLLMQLDVQSLAPDDYEVIVVDDGSDPPAADGLAGLTVRYPLRLERQANAGAATARDRGARLAEGTILVFIDDDMQVGPGFLEGHLLAHESGPPRVVLGRMRPAPGISKMPLFERFHARQLASFERGALRGSPISPLRLSTGNVSVRRVDLLAAGGFDRTLLRSEDRELGIRLAERGLPFTLIDDADAVHASDHEALDVWLDRAFRYGRYDLLIAQKHPSFVEADPWAYLPRVSPVSRPVLLSVVLAPQATRHLARGVMAVSSVVDRAGLEAPAIAGTTLAYGIDYFRGVRVASGSLVAAASGLLRHTAATNPGSRRYRIADALGFLATAVTADARAAREDHPQSRFLARPGGQMLLLIRTMQAAYRAGVPLVPQVLSRSLRHLFGAEIHWAADLAPGLRLEHGQGLTISHAARVASGVRLAQHVTLGDAVDGATRVRGAPTLEPDVEVGPGATLLGPITIGAGARIGPGVVLARPLAPGAVAKAPAALVRPRAPRRTPVIPTQEGKRRDALRA